ncbi:hypothetical protein NMY22_g13807 [Coprinellus aureogranulatus]|nr:hypothetical protein NMY22_g13807 [Coprinellus aureogranulatus]
MSDEGGSTLGVLDRAINCIPGKQNSRQGQRFSTMVQNSGIAKGQTFVLSIDCDRVLGELVPTSARRDFEESELEVGRRDVIPPVSGTTDEENLFPPDPSLNETSSTLVIDFGDLGSGKYTVDYKVDSGSVLEGAFIVDNMGDVVASSSSALAQGQSQQLSFEIEPNGELMGVGLILPTREGNGTTVSWTFQGEDLPPGATTTVTGGSSSSVPSGAGGSNSAARVRAGARCSTWVAVLAGLIHAAIL